MRDEMPSTPDHDPMLLDEQARATLRAYRECNEVPELVKARVRRRLGEADPVASTVRRTRTRAGAVAAIAAAAVLVVGALALLRARHPGAPAEQQAGHGAAYTQVPRAGTAAALRGGGAPMTIEAASPGDGSPDVAASLGVHSDGTGASRATDEAASGREAGAKAARAGAPVSGDDEAHGLTQASARRAATSPPDAVRPPGIDLAGERRLLEEAWRALAVGEHARAIESTRQHRLEHPDGVLSQEREAIEVIARCHLGAASAAADAAQFAASHGQSPWLTQVREACPVP